MRFISKASSPSNSVDKPVTSRYEQNYCILDGFHISNVNLQGRIILWKIQMESESLPLTRTFTIYRINWPWVWLIPQTSFNGSEEYCPMPETQMKRYYDNVRRSCVLLMYCFNDFWMVYSRMYSVIFSTLDKIMECPSFISVIVAVYMRVHN